MKRTLFKVISILILGSMVFSGCQQLNYEGNQQADVAMGRYLEEFIDMGEIIQLKNKQAISLLQGNQGQAQVMLDNGASKFSIYEERENKCIKINSDLSEAITKEKLSGIKLIENITKENKTYIIGEMQGVEVPYVGIFTNNALRKIDMEWRSNRKLIKEVHISQDKLFMLNYEAFEIEIYDLKTGKYLGTMGDNVETFTVIENKLYEVNYSKRVIERYDIQTGTLEMSVECELSRGDNKLTKANDEAIYLANDKGIFYLAKDEQLVEKIMNGDLYSLSTPTKTLMDIKVCDNTIYCVFLDRSDHQYRLVKYVYHKEVPTVPQNQVNVLSLYECPILKQAAQLYKQKHPDANISFEIAFSEGGKKYTEADKNQVIEKFNTQILAGDAPDLIVLDDLPIEAYQKAGLFENLSEILEDVSQSGESLDNIMKTCITEDKVYALPLRFGFMTAIGESQIIKDGISLENLSNYQMLHGDEKIVSSLAPEKLLEKMSRVWKDRLFSTDEKVNQEQMKRFLMAIKTLQPMPEGEKDCYFDTFYEDIDEFVKNKSKVEIREIEDQNDLQVLMYAKEQHKNAIIANNIEQVNDIAYLKQLVGVNSQSNKKEEAKELLRLALSKEVQQADLYDGLSVYKPVIKDWFLTNNKRENTFAYYTLWYGEDHEFINFDWGYLDEMQDFIERLQKAKVIKPMDSNLLRIIEQESEGYFKGEIEVDEAIKNITGKVELYLSEKN
ncbi:MAG: hypothetical protein AB9856_13435 [Cellulosilyticaceae bacterium]